MKIMRKITFLLFTVFILFSCSSDDPITDNGSSSKPQRRIAKIETFHESSSWMYHATEIFTYDSQGRWIRSEYNRTDGDSNYGYTNILSYSENTIIFKEVESSTNEKIFKVNKNLIVSREDAKWHDIDEYHYSNGYLTRIGEDKDNPYAKFEYTNGNLTKVDEGLEGISTITYTDYPDKMGFSTYSASYNDGAVELTLNNILYQFGYFGTKSKNLIKSINTTSYSYKFDSEGYVTEVVEVYIYQGKTETSTYKIYYE